MPFEKLVYISALALKVSLRLLRPLLKSMPTTGSGVSGPHTGLKMRSHRTHCSWSSQDRAAGLLPIPPGLPSAILKINRASTVSMTPQPVLLSFLILAEISNFTVLILVQLNLAFSSFRLCHESNSKREKKMSAGFSPQGRKEGADGIQLPLPS